MEKFHRIFELHQIFANRWTPVSLASLCERMECSKSTIRRAFRFLRDQLNAPLSYDKHQNEHFELLGLWFSPEELYALLVSSHLLKDLQSGFLSERIALQ